MATRILKATHEGRLRIGAVEIPCAVLDSGLRVLSLRGFMSALGYRSAPESRRGATGNSLLEYLPAVLVSNVSAAARRDLKLYRYQPLAGERGGPQEALGVKDDALAIICESILRARDLGALRSTQSRLADVADVLIRGFARTGIHALVDEATGYQEVRDKDALEQILKRYISEEMQSWVKRFPDEYYLQIARLNGWDIDILGREKPGVVGRMTNNIVYARLAPGVLVAVHNKVPRNSEGKLTYKLHQHLTLEHGVRELEKHLHALIQLMKLSATWDGFMRNLNKVMPVPNSTMLLPLEEDE